MAGHDNKKKTILYADYSERNISAARTAVEPFGFDKFIDCDDRERTVELIAELKPDLVLIGLYLDGIRGISTIRAIRDAATDANPHGRTVPILLGAPKLDRRGMRDAVDAGIEGVFRQPIDPKRLVKIIETVLKKPRRFVLEENYFGPARPQDLAKQAKPSEAEQAQESDDMSTASPEMTTQPSQQRVPSMLDLVDIDPRSKEAGKPLEDEELVAVPTANDRKTTTQNMEAIRSARNELASTDIPPEKAIPAEPIQAKAVPAVQVQTEQDMVEEDTIEEDQELVEIDLQEALISHKLWVDTGGREGAVMSIEHADLREAELEGIDLSRCGLPFASFQRANCKDAVLRRCNLIAADFVESNLDNANLAASRLAGARFNKAMMRNTVFLGSDLSNASFRGLKMPNCDLSGTNLAGTDFRDADLSGARGLFAEQIQRARVNANTRLPRDLKLRD
jgi:DNA-binding NarL/FixJ family response regulator